MKRLITLFSLLLAFSAGFAQFQNLVVEEVDNKGMVPGKTYRIYAQMTNPQDHVHAVFATDGHPLYIRSSKPFYQHKYGGATTSGLNVKLIEDHPELAYDSWVTIGMDENTSADLNATPIQDSVATFMENALNMMTLDTRDFETGGSLEVQDGAWFCIPSMPQIRAGADNRVLLMQLTTEGKIEGLINLQGMYVVPVRTENGTEDFQQTWQEFDLRFAAGK